MYNNVQYRSQDMIFNSIDINNKDYNNMISLKSSPASIQTENGDLLDICSLLTDEYSCFEAAICVSLIIENVSQHRNN